MESTVNERIKMLRNSLNGMSQQDFANRLGVTNLTVLRWEKGQKISNKQLNKISEVFGISFEWLAKGTGEMNLNFPFNFEKEKTDNPWKDALVSQLKDENSFLKDQLKMMREMIQIIKPQANFHNGIDLAGVFIERNPINTVRA